MRFNVSFFLSETNRDMLFVVFGLFLVFGLRLDRTRTISGFYMPMTQDDFMWFHEATVRMADEIMVGTWEEPACAHAKPTYFRIVL